MMAHAAGDRMLQGVARVQWIDDDGKMHDGHFRTSHGENPAQLDGRDFVDWDASLIPVYDV